MPAQGATPPDSPGQPAPVPSARPPDTASPGAVPRLLGEAFKKGHSCETGSESAAASAAARFSACTASQISSR